LGSVALLDLTVLFLPVLLILRGVLVGYLADRLHIRRPYCVGAATVLSGNMLLILAAMIGYRRVDSSSDDQAVCYSPFARIFTACPVVIPLLLFILLSVINPPYIALFFEDWLGIALLGIAIFTSALGVLSLWFGFWRNKAQTGFGIAIVSTITGWLSLITIWMILLGPAAVKVKQMFPEGFDGI
jgi:MFS family permease